MADGNRRLTPLENMYDWYRQVAVSDNLYYIYLFTFSNFTIYMELIVYLFGNQILFTPTRPTACT